MFDHFLLLDFSRLILKSQFCQCGQAGAYMAISIALIELPALNIIIAGEEHMEF